MLQDFFGKYNTIIIYFRYDQGYEVPVNAGNAKDAGNRNDEPTVQLDKTPGKYLNQMLKVPLDEFKICKTAREEFSVTMDYSMKIVEYMLIILEIYGCLVQVCCFPGEAEVKVLVDALKKYEPAYDDSVQRKSCLKKMPLIFEFFNRTYNF